MKVLVAHNAYREAGGEDAVFAAEVELLRAHGHEVIEYRRTNDDIDGMTSLTLAKDTLWSDRSRRELRTLIGNHRPDIAHFHNTFPLISPSAYHACRQAGIPVVQTIHNYRLLCIGGTLHRQGSVCERCVGKSPWRGVIGRCYRGSRAASAATATMLAVHRAKGTWRNAVTTYVATSEFARQKLVEGRLPADRIVVKPNFLPVDPGEGRHDGGYVLYVGRLSDEKGIRTMLAAWETLEDPPLLKVAGDGPLRGLFAGAQQGVEWLGMQPRRQVLELMRGASMLLFPTECYEGFPVTLVEAFATGLPVVASRIGAVATIVSDQRNGVHFEAGSAESLAERIRWARSNANAMRAMGAAGRSDFVTIYSAEANYRTLRAIYDRSLRSDRVSVCA